MNTNKNLLVIDDSKLVHSIISNSIPDHINMISRFEASNVLEELDQFDIDIILCDINMPGISGIEFCKSLKKSKHSEIPLIFITSQSDAEDISQGLLAGANDYLIKPFKPQELIVRLNNHLRMHDLYVERQNLYAQNDFNKMVDILSHEINNPLFIAQGYLKKFEDLDEAHDKYLKKINNSLNRIKDVLVKIREIESAQEFY